MDEHNPFANLGTMDEIRGWELVMRKAHEARDYDDAWHYEFMHARRRRDAARRASTPAPQRKGHDIQHSDRSNLSCHGRSNDTATNPCPCPSRDRKDGPAGIGTATPKRTTAVGKRPGKATNATGGGPICPSRRAERRYVTGNGFQYPEEEKGPDEPGLKSLSNGTLRKE